MSWTPRTLGHFLERNARERGAAEAVVTGSSRVSYEDLFQRARSVAGYLQSNGIRRGDHVGILMGNDEKWLALFYGAALVGAVTVPVNTRFKAAEIEYCVKQSDCRLLFYVPRFMKQDFASFTSTLDIPKVDVSGALPQGKHEPVVVSPDDVLLIQFTSGTTAYPKSVMLSHDMMLRDASAAGARVGIRPEDRYFNCRPFFHVAGSTLSALMSLVAGATLVTLPAFEAGPALEMMERERCTLVSGNDTIFQMLMGHEDFPKRKLALRGGWAAAGPQTMKKIIDVLGARTICAAYGLSEASPNVVMSDWREPEELRVQGLPLPLPGVEVRISEENEIQVRGWNVMKGYYKMPEQTAKAIDTEGWLHTGDFGVMDDDGRLRARKCRAGSWSAWACRGSARRTAFPRLHRTCACPGTTTISRSGSRAGRMCSRALMSGSTTRSPVVTCRRVKPARSWCAAGAS